MFKQQILLYSLRLVITEYLALQPTHSPGDSIDSEEEIAPLAFVDYQTPPLDPFPAFHGPPADKAHASWPMQLAQIPLLVAVTALPNRWPIYYSQRVGVSVDWRRKVWMLGQLQVERIDQIAHCFQGSYKHRFS